MGQYLLYDREKETQGFAAGGGGCDDYIFAPDGLGEHLGLMGIEALDAGGGQMRADFL